MMAPVAEGSAATLSSVHWVTFSAPSHFMKVKLRVWRQRGPGTPGGFVEYGRPA